MSTLGELWYSLRLDDKDFKKDLENIKRTIQGLNSKENIKINASEVDNAISRVNDLQRALNDVSAKPLQDQLNAISSTLEKMRANGGINGIGGGNTELGRRVRIQRDVNKAATDELGVRRAINTQMSANTQLATMFGNAVGNVFATYQLQRFLEGLIQIGGEIQKQRMALGHILGNDSQAMVLFEQMKTLAVKSPYGLMDLMGNARQLSAFGVQYNNLYDTMKRLSDVASGLGIEFSRLSLAYGETMERGFLDGKLVRQFSYMGLPVLQKIAEYYTEINKAGNGSIFSVTDVRKMVSSREVSFEDVSEVFKRLTDEGGQFYNMQEVMAESVAGKWKNLKDAYDVMLSDMTEGNSALLKAPAEFLTVLMRNYEAFLPIITAVAGTMMGAKMASKLYTATMGTENAMLTASIQAEKAKVIAQKQRAAAMRGASIAQLQEIAISKQLTLEELKQAIQKGKINAEEARYIVLRQGVTKENAKALLGTRLITQAQYDYIMSSGKLAMTFKTVGIRMQLLNIQLRMLAANMRASLAAMAWNPMTWVMVAASALTSLASAYIRTEEKNDELAKGMRNRLRELGQDAEEISTRVNIKYETNDDGTVSYKATVAEMQTAIDSLVKFIKDNVPGAQDILSNAFALDDNDNYIYSIEARYEILKHYYDKIKDLANDDDATDIMDAVQKSFGGTFWNAIGSDDLLRDASDYEKNYKNMIDALKEAFEEGGDEAKAAFKKWQNELGVNSPNKLFEELLKPENADKYKDFFKDIQNKISFSDFFSISFAKTNLNRDFKEFKEELDSSMTDLEKHLRTTFGDKFSLKNMTNEQKLKVAYEIRSFLDSSDTSEWVKEHMAEYFNTNWSINITMNGEVEKAKDYLKDKYGSFADETIVKSQENVYKKYKEARESLEKLQNTSLKGITKKDGIFNEATMGLENEAKEANGYIKTMNDAIAKAKADNMDLEAMWNAEKNKSKGTGSKKDTVLEAFKEKVDEIKKAYSEFKKWSEKIGKEGAGDYLSALGLVKKGELKNFADPKAYLNYIDSLIADWKGKVGNNAQRQKMLNSLLQLKADVELNIKDEEIKRATERVQREINQAAKKYDIWKSWFNASGDSELAMKMAITIVPVWDERTADLKAQLENEINGKGIELDWSRTASMIKMQENFQKAGMTETFNKYKSIYDLIWSAGEEASKNLATAIGEMKTASENAKIIADKYERLIATDKAQGGANVGRLSAKRDAELLEQSSAYVRFMQNTYTMSEQAAINFGETLKREVENNFKRGGMTAEKYSKTIAEIDKKMQQTVKNSRGSGAFGMKNFSELIKSQQEKGQQMISQGAKDYENAQAASKEATKNMDWGEIMKSNDMMASAKDMTASGEGIMQGVSEAEGAVGIVDMVIHGINDTVQALKQSVQYIDEMLESFGVDTSLKSGWGQSKFALDTFAESSQHATNSWDNAKSGNIAGMVTEQIGSVTSIITGINKLADGRREEMIKEMERQNNELSNIRDTLERKLERSLSGLYKLTLDATTRNKLNDIASSKSSYGSDVKVSAKKALESDSYYDAQFALLKAQQDNIKNMYKTESENKNVDKDKLEDYRKQMEDINDEVKYFATDMANTLYGIDFKSWAGTIADSIVGAWQKGEDAVLAYKNSVSDMLASVAKSVVSQKIIGTYLEENIDPWLEKFAGAEGRMNDNLFADLNNIFSGLESRVAMGETFLDAWEEIANRYGQSLKENETVDGSVTSAIKGVSEETADILAAYINGMRVDLSLQRTAVEKIANIFGDPVGDYQTMFALANAQLTELKSIVTNTANTSAILQDIHDDFVAVQNGTKTMHIE